jgi:hypothetical protein
MKSKSNKLNEILIGIEHETLEDAIAADIISAVPVLGGLSDFFRLMETEKRPRKLLQAVDLITSPLPGSDLLTPTNTLIFLDKKGMLPVELSKISGLFDKFKLFK